MKNEMFLCFFKSNFKIISLYFKYSSILWKQNRKHNGNRRKHFGQKRKHWETFDVSAVSSLFRHLKLIFFSILIATKKLKCSKQMFPQCFPICFRILFSKIKHLSCVKSRWKHLNRKHWCFRRNGTFAIWPPK